MTADRSFVLICSFPLFVASQRNRGTLSNAARLYFNLNTEVNWISSAQTFPKLFVGGHREERKRGARKSCDISNKKIFCPQLLPFQLLEKQTPFPESVSCLWKRVKIMHVLERYVCTLWMFTWKMSTAYIS